MNKAKRDIIILQKILKYCDGIAGSVNRFGKGVATLESDDDYKDSVAMKILQIGELTTHLSDDFKASHSEIPWRAVKNMRNIAAHEYDKFEVEYLWGTINEDIPALRDYCDEIVRKHQEMEQACAGQPEQGQ